MVFHTVTLTVWMLQNLVVPEQCKARRRENYMPVIFSFILFQDMVQQNPY